jgi:hypothetical protein
MRIPLHEMDQVTKSERMQKARSIGQTCRHIMRKLSDVILEQHALIMNETASVMAACEWMRAAARPDRF